jgi:hypothetical protein
VDLFGELRHRFGKPRRFSGGDPLDGEPCGVDALEFQDDLGGFASGQGFVITFQVMTFAQVSAHQDDPVGSPVERFEDQIRVHHARAHHPHGAHVGRILQPGDACQISAGIGAPVAEKPQNHRLEFFTHFSLLLLLLMTIVYTIRYSQFPTSFLLTREKCVHEFFPASGGEN